MEAESELKALKAQVNNLESRLRDLSAYTHALFKELRQHKDGHN